MQSQEEKSAITQSSQHKELSQHASNQVLEHSDNTTSLNSIPEHKQQKIQQLRQWMRQKGCIIHPNVQIPAFINGVQGVASTKPIPHKTLIIAIPSSLILTVTRCYKDPLLKSLFTRNDQLFDYQASDDNQFNVLCVFLMYHKLHIQKSEWRIYLQTIGQPQTAIDWPNTMLKGLNKAVIQQILHVRIQCQKLRQKLCDYLSTTQQFKKFTLQQLHQCFNYCYRAVMTRCFGYYFGQSAMIPIADLINHGCETVDHQLINVSYEKGLDFNQDYKEKSQRMDCGILGIKRGREVQLPFRERFLLKNGLIEEDQEKLARLNRSKMDEVIGQFNKRRLDNEEVEVDGLDFCEEDDSEDNDTDQDEVHQRQNQLQRLHVEQLQQIENFKKYYQSVRVQTYKQVEERFEKYEKELGEGSDEDWEDMPESKNDALIRGVVGKRAGEEYKVEDKRNKQEQVVESNNIQKENQQKVGTKQQDSNDTKQQPAQSSSTTPTPTPQPSPIFFPTPTPHPHRSTVPIQLIDSSSSSQQQDDQSWGLAPQSYFTMSTRSPVPGNTQLLNSYGSRTNRFLLVWYGFCYRDNLFDSVSVRLHVKFKEQIPKADTMVLDTYVGGQGRSFRKNQSQMVKPEEVSKQFRLKLNKICMKLITFLRLFLLEYYKGKDLYKICVTLPSSIGFQMMVLRFYQDVVRALYDRYPITIIEQLKKQMQDKQTKEQDRYKINFKIIYLQEQLRILDSNMDAVQAAIKVWQKIKHQKQAQTYPIQKFGKEFYKDLTIYQLRKLRPYLTLIKSNYHYVMYEHQQTQKK